MSMQVSAFQVLGLAACVLNNVSNSDLEDRFNLMVTEIVGNVASSKYTASCRDMDGHEVVQMSVNIYTTNNLP